MAVIFTVVKAKPQNLRYYLNVMEIFAIRLKELRTEKNLTQKDLAAAINTTDDSIYSWEKGRSQPSFEMLCCLARFFEVSAGYLLGAEDEFGTPPACNYLLTKEEKELIESFRALDKKQKDYIKDTVISLNYRDGK